MHFPSLSVLTTLACAAFSLAAPLNPLPIPAGVTEIGNSITTRDTPGTELPADCPLVVALNDFVTDLQPALDEVVKVVNGKVTVEVDTKQLAATVLTVVAVVADHVEDIKNAALVSVDNVQAQVVATLLVQILTAVYTALNTVAAVPGVVHEVLDPVLAQVGEQLVAIIVVVKQAVPSLVELVLTEVLSLFHLVSHLSLAVILEALGITAPGS